MKTALKSHAILSGKKAPSDCHQPYLQCVNLICQDISNVSTLQMLHHCACCNIADGNSLRCLPQSLRPELRPKSLVCVGQMAVDVLAAPFVLQPPPHLLALRSDSTAWVVLWQQSNVRAQSSPNTQNQQKHSHTVNLLSYPMFSGTLPTMALSERQYQSCL